VTILALPPLLLLLLHTKQLIDFQLVVGIVLSPRVYRHRRRGMLVPATNGEFGPYIIIRLFLVSTGRDDAPRVLQLSVFVAC